MFEKTRAAEAKAKEHLDSAEVLANRRLFVQAYAHLVLALEESAVAGVRMLTESEMLSWASPPAWFKWKESDLSRPGTHRQLLRLGLAIATIRSALETAAPKEVPNEPAVVLDLLLGQAMAPALESILRLFTDPVLKGFLVDGDRRKMAAFYSSPWKPSPMPTEADYHALLAVAQPLVLNLQRELPTAGEMAQIGPLLQKLAAVALREFDAKKVDLREAIRRSMTEGGASV